jgi:hypothetical protein
MTKNTLEIITLDKPGVTDFAKERNILLEKSKSDWVFFVDSDESATPELMKEISGKINKVPNLAGYKVRRKIYFLGKEIGWDEVIRLGRKKAGKWERAIHETWQINQEVGLLDGYIIHNTASNLHEYIEKMNKYSSIHALENLKENKRANLYKIISYPKMKFIQNILSGRGFVFSMLQAFHSFLAWVKLWQLQEN